MTNLSSTKSVMNQCKIHKRFSSVSGIPLAEKLIISLCREFDLFKLSEIQFMTISCIIFTGKHPTLVCHLLLQNTIFHPVIWYSQILNLFHPLVHHFSVDSKKRCYIPYELNRCTKKRASFLSDDNFILFFVHLLMNS